MTKLSMKHWFIISGCVVMTFLLVIWFLGSSAPKETEVKTVKIEEPLEEIENTVEATQKANDFVLSKVPDSDVFLKFHLSSSEDGDEGHEGHEENELEHSFNHEHEQVSMEDRQLSALEMFYGAITTESSTYLTTALTPESFQEIWGEEMDFEIREKKIAAFLKELNGAGTLTSMDYKLNVDKFDHTTDNGTIIFMYADKSTTEVPFSFVTMGEGDQKNTQIDLSEFVSLRSN
ncbi:hypothetical protein CW734_00060 (plasmid) [Planococcus sp. MB-3u-03]|uniref:hypothetical protein n=1 Tax=Planococcus sp. MB-3u-03 TaxID=2058136 RepID=UPI000C34F45E|nr:hypothetical protein [Planococcus sp. MB-3u-03]AUD12309.1 hypothetical protein CW734_00060 [Planococcus sp. MB-3u-03]